MVQTAEKGGWFPTAWITEYDLGRTREIRYDGFSRKPLEFNIPYFDGLDVYKVRNLVGTLLTNGRPWPEYLIKYHRQRM